MAISERQLLDALSRTPFVDSTELAGILGEMHATVHRTLTNLMAEGIVGRASHGTAHLPSSERYHLTAQGVGEAACFGSSLQWASPLPQDRIQDKGLQGLTLDEFPLQD